jgi:hypothetical protein
LQKKPFSVPNVTHIIQNSLASLDQLPVNPCTAAWIAKRLLIISNVINEIDLT